MKVKYKHKVYIATKRKKRRDWKKRLIYIIMMMLIANFFWDAYNRVPDIKIYSDKYCQSTIKYSKIYYNKALTLLKKDKKD